MLECQYKTYEGNHYVQFSRWTFTTSLNVIKSWYDKPKIDTDTVFYIRPVILQDSRCSTSPCEAGKSGAGKIQSSSVVVIDLDNPHISYKVPLTYSKRVRKVSENAAKQHNIGRGRGGGRSRGRGRGRGRGRTRHHQEDDSSIESSDAEDWIHANLLGDGDDDNDDEDATFADRLFREGIASLAEETEQRQHESTGQELSTLSLAANGTNCLLSGQANIEQDISDEEFLDGIGVGGSGDKDVLLRAQEEETHNIEMKRVKAAVKNQSLDLSKSFSSMFIKL